jgi:hypothetical protein
MLKSKIASLLFIVKITFLANLLSVSYLLQKNKHWTVFRSKHEFICSRHFNELKNYMGFTESLALTQIKNDDILIEINGFNMHDLKCLSNILNQNLHYTEKLALYSLNYLVQAIKSIDFIKTKEKLDLIKENLIKSLDYLERWSLVPDRLKFNDHVVSTRLESLILLKSFFEEQNHLSEDLSKIMDKHIKLCILELIDNKKFTWRTNHGLMQIRALLAFDFAMKENPLTQKVRNAIAERLEDHILLDFHIAADGSVFEAATGYWRYVYSQWEAISVFPQLQNDSVLQHQLERSKKFLAAVTASGGFMQGVGDSYSSYSIPRNDNIQLPVNYTYRFGNGVAGANIIDSNKNNLHLKFISLDNPPHVKKHPEDLAVYIYLNQPYFINPGTYAWENSSERRHVLSQNVQNTFYNPNYSESDSSAIHKSFTGENEISFKGAKWYGAEKLERRIIIDLEDSTIQIIDWGATDNLITGFNIHPDINIRIVDSLTFQLLGKDNAINVHSNIPGSIKKEKISDSYNSLIEIDRIEFETDSLILNFAISEFEIINKAPVAINNADKSYQRAKAGDFLARKYWKNEFFKSPSPKRLIYPRIFILITFTMLIVVLPKKYNWSIVLLYILTSVVDVFMNGWLFSLFFM